MDLSAITWSEAFKFVNKANAKKSAKGQIFFHSTLEQWIYCYITARSPWKPPSLSSISNNHRWVPYSINYGFSHRINYLNVQEMDLLALLISNVALSHKKTTLHFHIAESLDTWDEVSLKCCRRDLAQFTLVISLRGSAIKVKTSESPSEPYVRKLKHESNNTH